MAHRFFDVLWLYKYYYSGKSIRYWRTRQYKWLARKMNISIDQCHISQFNKTQCKQVVDLCSEEFANNEALIAFADRMDEGRVMNWFKIK